MTMVYKENGEFLVQERLASDWPGINFPGGHVKDHESIEESAIREMKEETGLDVAGLECVGYFEWNLPDKGLRHLAILFRTSSFKGEIVSSSEGPIRWMRAEELQNKLLSADFDKILKIMSKGLKGF